MAIFRDREEAGRFLAEAMKDLKGKENTLILAIPRGGVIVGKTIAKELQLPLDIIVTRKIGTPGIPELAMGATTSEGGTLWNEDVVRATGVHEGFRKESERSQIEEAKRRERLYRRNRSPLALAGKEVVLVDDGVATGFTMEAAIRAVRKNDAGEVIVAIPVAPRDTAARFAAQVDRLVVLATPEPFCAISVLYRDFEQVTDAEVERILEDDGEDHGNHEKHP